LLGTLKAFLDRKHVVTHFSDGTRQDFYTLTEIKIEKIIKQPDSLVLNLSQTLEVIEPITVIDEGKSGKVKLARDNYLELRRGSRYILFLKKGLGVDNYFVINRNLGKFNLDGTDVDDLGEEDKPVLRKEKLNFKKDVLKKYGDKLK